MSEGPQKPPPAWTHETFPLQIGGREFVFRTLSFAQTVAVRPYIGRIRRAIKCGEPLESNKQVLKVLSIVQPALAADEKAIRALSREHLDLLAGWYSSRQPVLVGLFATCPDDVPEHNEEIRRQGILLTCAGAAIHAGMTAEAFVKERFEFCGAQFEEALRRPS